MNSATVATRLKPLGQKIFLDRYALKETDRSKLRVGDTLLVTHKEHPKWPVRAIATALEVREDEVLAEYRDPDTGDPVVRVFNTREVDICRETIDEATARVARGLAVVEKDQEYWAKKFESVLSNFRFVPGGRIYTGAGSGLNVTWFNCLPPEQEVLTVDGYKPIKDVRVGDEVITHKKRPRVVTNVMHREASEPLYVIRPEKLGFDDLRVTGEHPILAIRQEWVNSHRDRDGLRLKEQPQWIKAKELRKGDFVAVGWNEEVRNLATINVIDYLPAEFAVEGDRVVRPSDAGHPAKSILNRLVVDEDLMLLFGTWLGDGCITYRSGGDVPTGIQITFNEEQETWAQEIAEIIRSKFDIEVSVKPASDGQRLIQVQAFAWPLGAFFEAMFGRYSHGKRIPAELMVLNRDLTLALVKGILRSDGYTSGSTVGFQLSNKQLASQLHQLLLRLGYFFNLNTQKQQLSEKPGYRVNAAISEAADLMDSIFGEIKSNERHNQNYYLEYAGLKWVRISEIEVVDYKGIVYDIEVEEDHSFISAGVVVHNCYVLPSPHDSRKGIFTRLGEMAEVLARGGGVGLNFSSLRPRNAIIKGTMGRSSGSVSWANVYSHTILNTSQGGSRRGAGMAQWCIWHPDVPEVIDCKKTPGYMEGFNISIRVSRDFMETLEQNGDWTFVFPDTTHPAYDEEWDGNLKEWLAKGYPVIEYDTIKARDLWDKMMQAAWASAEPGIIFEDTIEDESNSHWYTYLVCTNP